MNYNESKKEGGDRTNNRQNTLTIRGIVLLVAK